MPPGIGYSYQPGAGSDIPMDTARRQPLGSQEAVRILSLRLPRRVGPGSVAPLSLLEGGGSASAGGGDLSGLLRMLMQAFGGSGTRTPVPGEVTATDSGLGGPVKGPHFPGITSPPRPRVWFGEPTPPTVRAPESGAVEAVPLPAFHPPPAPGTTMWRPHQPIDNTLQPLF